jgi:hypothetical protein
MSSNPDWTKDEVILALDLYINRADRTQLPINHPEVIRLSNRLRSFDIYPISERGDSFRNPNSVHIRLGGFLSLDPKYEGEGMKGSTSKLVQSVWDEFSHDHSKLSEAAKAIEQKFTSRKLGNAPNQ